VDACIEGLAHITCWRQSVPVRDARDEENAMAWTTPTLVEIRIGLEINGYLPGEF
jgi:coenzyme PQQ precursor peptide PqqA